MFETIKEISVILIWICVFVASHLMPKIEPNNQWYKWWVLVIGIAFSVFVLFVL